jgi:hypothetical protein
MSSRLVTGLDPATHAFFGRNNADVEDVDACVKPTG